MRSLAEQLTLYNRHHKNRTNRMIHFFGIPLIVYGLLVLFGWVHIRVPNVFNMPVSWLLTIILLIYYFMLDISLAAALTLAFIIFNLIATLTSGNKPSWLSLQLFLYPFILGWLLLFIGHFFEKKRPAFSHNLWQMLIGPMFLMAEVFFHFGYKQGLKKRIDDLQDNT